MNFCNELTIALRQIASPEDAISMRAYMKENFHYLGVKTEARRHVLKELIAIHVDEIKSNYRTITLELFQQPYRELHQCGIDLLLQFSKKNWQESDNVLLEKLLLTNSWWDSVDTLAKYGVGAYLVKFPEKKHSLIENFSNSDSMWLQRTAIIFQLGYKSKTDFDLLKAECLKHSQSNEFFIQKAIGWALREYGAVNPNGVIEFVNTASFKPLSRKEALRKLIK